MERRRFLKVTLATSVGPFLIPTVVSARRAPFETIGLYCSLPTDLPPKDSNTYDFFKACGYNYLEFCEAGFRYRPDLLPDYYEQMTHAVNLAHEKGFRVGIVLLAGMEQWKGPGKIGYAGTFSTLDQTKLAERLVHLRREVSLLKNADAFIVIPGDPGGDPKGRTTLNDCITFCRQVQDIVKEEAPRASFSVNLWGVAEWEGFPSAFSLRFWQQEANLSRRLASSDLLGPNCGVAFPLHNYYRPLTLALYSKAGLQPDIYPASTDIQRLRARGVKPLLGWPYFLVDEADEGYMSPNNVESGGQSSAETRYIRALVDTGHRIGLDGLVANAIFFQAESLNIYAFGQMCRADLSPGQVLDQYAGFIADEKSKGSLGRILRYIENNSNWQNSFPASYRLKELDVSEIDSASAALKMLAQVKPCEHPAIPLLEAPAVYLGRLKRRLESIAAGKVGGVSNDLNN